MGQSQSQPENYKMTELGPLPEEWRVVRLEDVVAEITTGDWGQSATATGFVKCLVLREQIFQKRNRVTLALLLYVLSRPPASRNASLHRGIYWSSFLVVAKINPQAESC